jgi:molecular chaperone DnaJ
VPMTKDYYDILGVDRSADEKAIKAAYRRQARECHPDVNPDDPQAEERFKELSQAYAVLGDPQKRAAYDRYGHDFASRTGNGGTQYTWQEAGGPGPFAGGDVGGFGDLFETLFGGGMGGATATRQARPERGRSLEQDIAVDFADAIFGTEESLRIELDEPCEDCSGHGYSYRACPSCGGTGADASRRSMLGMAPCSECRGSGEIPDRRCEPCRGTGTRHRSRRVSVKIPAGVQDGSRVRVRGEGMAGLNGGPRGDLILTVRLKEHSFFGRKGDDLTCEIPVSFAEACLGAEITVPTKDGRAKLKVPAGTQSGRIMRLRGMGAPHLNGSGTGDQLVTIRVSVPTKVGREARRLIEELDKEINDDPRAGIPMEGLRRAE